jgi:UDP-4-amino-4,6-dideoxy-N-acetyl-beta-L-altrosamine transaminase
VPDRLLPYGRQWVQDDDIAAVTDVLRSDFLTTGPAVERFEQELSAYAGAAHAVAVNSGTAALHAAYFAAGIGPGDEIVTSPLTFAATANAALYLGASVRFADVTATTGCLDPDAALAAVGPRTKAVVAVDYAGHPADYDALAPLEERGIRVIADAAHSLGASYRGRPVGTLAPLTVLSFHPVKLITTAEGGAVLTDEAGAADTMAQFRTHGVTRDRAQMSVDEGPWYYEQVALGFNYRLTDIQAALGSSQLRRLSAFVERRRAIAAAYLEAFADLESVAMPSVEPDVEPAWHLFVIRVRDPQHRRPLFERLREAGLGVQVHYIPVYWHPYYQRLGYARGLCPTAEAFYGQAISLPMFPRMTDAELGRVVDIVRTEAQALVPANA